jgi:hypothetical protein
VTRAGKSVERDKPATGDNEGYFQRLHALWDSGYRVNAVADRMVALPDIGYSDKPDMARVASQSTEIVAKYLPLRPSLTPDASVWATESSRISCEWAFDTPRGEAVSPAYITRVHDTCCARLAVAGVRMAAWLETNLR